MNIFKKLTAFALALPLAASALPGAAVSAETVSVNAYVTTDSSSPCVAVEFQLDRGSSSCRLFVKNKATGKYELCDSCDDYWGTLYAENVSSESVCDLAFFSYNDSGETVDCKTFSVYIEPPAPSFYLTTDPATRKTTLNWQSNQDNAAGCEIYAKVIDDKTNTGTGKYKKAFDLDKPSGKLTVVNDSDSHYDFYCRTYRMEDGEKIYSMDSSKYCSVSTEALYVNALTLNPKAVCRGEELELVKKYVDSTITSDMSNSEKLKKIFSLVSSHGTYQNDITLIDGNRPVWQIMEKQEGQCASWAYCLDAMLEYAGFDIRVVRGLRDSGQQHFWCQIELGGKWYNLDAQVGYYLTPYETDYIGYEIAEIC